MRLPTAELWLQKSNISLHCPLIDEHEQLQGAEALFRQITHAPQRRVAFFGERWTAWVILRNFSRQIKANHAVVGAASDVVDSNFSSEQNVNLQLSDSELEHHEKQVQEQLRLISSSFSILVRESVSDMNGSRTPFSSLQLPPVQPDIQWRFFARPVSQNWNAPCSGRSSPKPYHQNVSSETIQNENQAALITTLSSTATEKSSELIALGCFSINLPHLKTQFERPELIISMQLFLSSNLVQNGIDSLNFDSQHSTSTTKSQSCQRDQNRSADNLSRDDKIAPWTSKGDTHLMGLEDSNQEFSVMSRRRLAGLMSSLASIPADVPNKNTSALRSANATPSGLNRNNTIMSSPYLRRKINHAMSCASVCAFSLRTVRSAVPNEYVCEIEIALHEQAAKLRASKIELELFNVSLKVSPSLLIAENQSPITYPYRLQKQENLRQVYTLRCYNGTYNGTGPSETVLERVVMKVSVACRLCLNIMSRSTAPATGLNSKTSASDLNYTTDGTSSSIRSDGMMSPIMSTPNRSRKMKRVWSGPIEMSWTITNLSKHLAENEINSNGNSVIRVPRRIPDLDGPKWLVYFSMPESIIARKSFKLGLIVLNKSEIDISPMIRCSRDEILRKLQKFADGTNADKVTKDSTIGSSSLLKMHEELYSFPAIDIYPDVINFGILKPGERQTQSFMVNVSKAGRHKFPEFLMRDDFSNDPQWQSIQIPSLLVSAASKLNDTSLMNENIT